MVIGYGNKQVFVRHGGTYNWVSLCNLQLVNKVEESKLNKVDEDSDANVRLDLQKRENKENISEEHEEDDFDELAIMINQIDLHTDNSDNDNPTKKIWVVPSLGSKVTSEDPDRNEWRKAMILSRAGLTSKI